MVEYVRGSERDRWHWCKNCTQYPMRIYQKTYVEPPSGLCEQCKTREANRNCRYVELNKIMRESQLKS
jgi:hypothetical protein